MNEKMEMNQDEMEIDLKDLFNALKKKSYQLPLRPLSLR